MEEQERLLGTLKTLDFREKAASIRSVFDFLRNIFIFFSVGDEFIFSVK